MIFAFGGTLIVCAQQTSFEKIYTQTDRSFYFPGETIWFKSYITNADLSPTNSSDVFYAELISPKGSIIKKLTLPVTLGTGYGNFDISMEWAGGIYTLKVYTNWLQNYGEEAVFTKKITVQKVVKPTLLLTLKFQEEAYGSNSKVTALLSAETINNKPLTSHALNYVVAADGKNIIEGNTKTDKKGKANVIFSLPSTLKSSDVTLTAQLPYKGSTESISRGVPVVLKNIDLQFMPEGGSMLEEFSNLIAFKAVNEFGKPADIEGVIMDDKGELISSFKSYHDGMGGVKITPKKNTVYYARILKPYMSDSRIKLPEAKKAGVHFSLITINDTKKQLQVFSTANIKATLQISSASKKLYTKELFLKKGNNSHTFSTKDFPGGVAKISLKALGEIQAERLFFTNKASLMNIEVSLDKKTYQTREKTIVTIKTTDSSKKPIPANLSVSIADNKLLTFADDKQDHIVSQLLFSSELKGKIHKPVFYFDTKEPKANKALDFVMLTHGWRNYIKMEPNTAKFAFAKQLESTYRGKITNKKGIPVFAHLILFDNNNSKVLRFDTDTSGNFMFKSRNLRNAMLMAYTDDEQKVKISLQYPESTRFDKALQTPENKKRKENAPILEMLQNPLEKKIKQEAVVENLEVEAQLAVPLEEDAQALDEIVAFDMNVARERQALGFAASNIMADDIGVISAKDLGTILQGKTAGVQIVTNTGVPGATTNINIRGNASLSGLNNNPLIIIDGIPLNTKKAKEGIPNVNLDEIESINVLNGDVATTLYGNRANGGVIVLNTKSEDFRNGSTVKSINNQQYKNYSIEYIYNYRDQFSYSNVKEFYVPVYNSAELLTEDRTDFRQTVYWNPIVQTDENGEATFEFYNSDAISSFKIITEGINALGVPGRDETTYSTKKMLYTDVKIPAYLSVNDTIKLDLKIYNNSAKTEKVQFEATLPDGFKILHKNYGNVSIDAEGYANIPLEIIPLKKMENETLSISLQSENYQDFVSNQVTVVSPYFPTQTTIAGTTNETYSFEVKNSVPGSINASFNIYTDVVGDVMDGIASMLRQPYGCFEQTSSSTYPNVMILNYLQQAGKSNPDVEKQALDYIDKGYKRLIGFETAENGFEWFGNTPAHETLTAFGLLEFTEMKNVYPNVDEKMLRRTVKWLLSRRDGKGGFYKSKQGYDSFASSPQDVANAYIIYALSEAKIEVNLDLEYATALKDALKTNDSYKMALLACTAFNLRKKQDFYMLIEKLKAVIERRGFAELPFKNTITRSYGSSAQIETAAFTVLALLKEKNNERFVQKGIKYILNARTNGRFGATQATCMGLKALIEYTKSQKAKFIASSDKISLKLNGHDISKKLEINTKGMITISGLENYIKEGTQRFSVVFSNTKVTFPYALEVNYDSYLPASDDNCKVRLQTHLNSKRSSVGDNVRLQVSLKNQTATSLPMTMGIVGIPSGLSLQPWQLKKLIDEQKVAYYEIFGNHLVLYWRSMKAKETIEIPLDLKVEIAGSYTAPASTGYLYYEDEKKHWIKGSEISVTQ